MLSIIINEEYSYRAWHIYFKATSIEKVEEEFNTAIANNVSCSQFLSNLDDKHVVSPIDDAEYTSYRTTCDAYIHWHETEDSFFESALVRPKELDLF